MLSCCWRSFCVKWLGYFTTALLIFIPLWIVLKYYRHQKLMRTVTEIIQGRKMKNNSTSSSNSPTSNSTFLDLSLLPPSQHNRILQMSIDELLSAMAKKEFTSHQLVSLYISRCLQYGQQFNAITQEFYVEALNLAKESDQRRAQGQQPIRPLEGIPFSVKDCFDQKGADSFCGLASLIGKISHHDCPLVKILIDAGGIPFVRSNVPPILMAWESSNNPYGSSLNPWNKSKVTGGSSGGEAVLISSRCSPVGLGTDIGGSLRIPAACCGIYSLKPTTKRLTTKQIACQEVPGQLAILSSPGPMGRCVADLELLMRIWLTSPIENDDQDHDKDQTLNHKGLSAMWSYDPYTPPTTWRNPISGSSSSSSRPLRIGYITSNKFFTPAKCCQRALFQSIETLKEAGHTLIEWSPPSLSFSKAGFLANQVFIADRCQWLNSILGDEFPHYTMLGGVILGSLPPILLSFLAKGLKFFSYTRRLGLLLEHTFAHSYTTVSDVWKLNDEILKYQQQFYEHLKYSQLDMLLCPTMGLPAIDHKETMNLLPVVMYSSIFNVLQYPVGHVPITTVQSDECYYLPSSENIKRDKMEPGEGEGEGDGGGRGEGGEREREREREEEVMEKDLISQLAHKQMLTSKGLPVGISVIGLPYDDESVINVMKILERKYPFVPSI